MKRILILTLSTFVALATFAQAPELMSYQAVIRNSSDALVKNQSVGMQISILQGSSTGTAVYVETQTETTNTNGLVSIDIGGGTVVSGDFSAIDWSTGLYFIKSETDPTGGTNYTITGTTQLLSVPYALHAKTADNGLNNVIGGIDSYSSPYGQIYEKIFIAGGSTYSVPSDKIIGSNNRYYYYSSVYAVNDTFINLYNNNPNVTWITPVDISGTITYTVQADYIFVVTYSKVCETANMFYNQGYSANGIPFYASYPDGFSYYYAYPEGTVFTFDNSPCTSSPTGVLEGYLIAK